MDDVGLDVIDGRIDLRGFYTTATVFRPSEPAKASPASNGSRIAWERLDLSGAELPDLRLTDITIEDCLFDGANLTSLRCWGVTVSNCSFVRASLNRGQLGPDTTFFPRRGSWTNIDFTRADLRHAIADVDFHRVDFSNAKFTKTNWRWSNLTEVTFAGTVRGLTIGARHVKGRPSDWQLDRVDFSNAQLRRVEFIGVDLGQLNVRLPNDDQHLPVDDWPAFLDRVEHAAGTLPPGDLKIVTDVWLEYARVKQGPNQTAGLIVVPDVMDLGGSALLDLLLGTL